MGGVMAAKAPRRVIGRFAFKTPDELLRGFRLLCIAGHGQHGVRMCFSGAVAGFTARPKLCCWGLRGGMHGFLELLRFVLVASRASLDTRIVGRVGVRWRLPRNR